ncbi:MAG TPA: MOSC domain-containing protein, partial [Gemmatimonadaceae bacterium]|nr:MOSC domain-containing protein [Gemmatimonadaceae bacterium]
GEKLESAMLGWHGLEGDRRLALQRLDDPSGFPWLNASKLPELIVFTPKRLHGELPTHVLTPDGSEMSVFGEELAADVMRRSGMRVQMMHSRNGLFDDAHVSLIASDTVNEISRIAGVGSDVRRFRPNILVRLSNARAFQEGEWIGGIVQFGDGDDAPAVAVTMHDVRCSMINIDPDTAQRAPEMLKAAVSANDNNAGVYATVTRTGTLAIGQKIFLRA